MKKVLFLLHYRGGSCFFNFLNGCPTMHSIHTHDRLNPHIKEEDRLVNIDQWTGTDAGYWLSTVPSKVAACEHLYSVPLDDLHTLDLPLDTFGWWANVGDWWGEVASHHDVPQPYGVETFYRFAPQDLIDLPGDWQFIYVIRDGRNQVESMRRVRGGAEETKKKSNGVDYFQVLCKGWRNRARMVLDCAAQLPNCRVFRFEDLVSQPIKTMQAVYQFLGLAIDTVAVQSALEFTTQNVQHEHSSFKNSQTNDRWRSWSQEEVDLFHNIAGKELRELGYYD